MKFGIFNSLAAISLALADYNVTLVTESSSPEVNGKGLTPLHEGAGINFLFLSVSGASLVYSEETDGIYQATRVQGPNGTELSEWNVTVMPNTNAISAGVTGGTPVLVKDSYLTINGSTAFYAGKNTTSDLYGYSNYIYQLLGSSQPGALPVKVKVVSNSTESNSQPSSSLNSTEPRSKPNATSTYTPSVADSGIVANIGPAVAVVAAAAMLL